ncbi:uncharacterized protein LOC116159568 [Photinus pyralis]|uniref:uncharacterized protein LOC116159568 n=1 Tax=Photinus pyralis TaxID=7054 RepID=UPI0012672813|nr:uncharacterized protein LOC116159568 [Photinus pyralis]
MNAASITWGAPATNRRGVEVEEMLATLDLVPFNRGKRPTYERGDRKSIIDVTRANEREARDTRYWTVEEEETHSDHRYITWRLETSGGTKKPVNRASGGPQGLEQMMSRSKNQCWRQLCAELESDPWGRAYKIASGKLGKRQRVVGTDEEMIEKIRHLFPRQERAAGSWNDESREQPAEPNSDNEVREVARRMPRMKAPGVDGFHRSLSRALPKGPRSEADFQFGAGHGNLPDGVEERKIVLISKKDGETDCTYQPLKQAVRFHEGNGYALERIHARVEVVMRGTRRTREVAVVTSLNVRNVFNTVPVSVTMEALERKGVPASLRRFVLSYLTERMAKAKIPSGAEYKFEINGGVPQGSVLGPLLWNATYDAVMELRVPRGVELVAYADDRMIVVTDTELEMAARDIQVWMEDRGMQLVGPKTQAALLAGRRRLSFLYYD